ncbi:MAG: peptide-methionine (S)-S-oxide reductase MsrA [Helicobacter sp.]|nr:peptide-methionine (S)-S-oxide reductase MsrA [Helicobacter sp.]
MIIYLAGGCFWGVESFLSQIKGVTSTEVGYANGEETDPTYQAVCNGSGHVECVKVTFDTDILPLDVLLNYFYQIIDPTSLNKQGNDEGIQYRTGIYYEDISLKEHITESLKALQNEYQNKIAIENLPLKNYFKAEDYHQKYLVKNPSGYCHISKSRIRQILNID